MDPEKKSIRDIGDTQGEMVWATTPLNRKSERIPRPAKAGLRGASNRLTYRFVFVNLLMLGISTTY